MGALYNHQGRGWGGTHPVLEWGGKRPDLAKMRFLLKNPSREMEIGIKSLGHSLWTQAPCHSWASQNGPSLTCPGRESTGNHQQHCAPGEQHSWELLLCAVQEPGERSAQGAVGGYPQARQVSSRGCGEPRRPWFLPFISLPSHPIPQLLKKIKRCESGRIAQNLSPRRVCLLSPPASTAPANKLPIQLQVSLGPRCPAHRALWILTPP